MESYVNAIIWSTEEYKFVTKLLDIYRELGDILGDEQYDKFAGFSELFEPIHYACCKFILLDENKYSEQEFILKGNQLDSKEAMLDKYKKILGRYSNLDKEKHLEKKFALDVLNV